MIKTRSRCARGRRSGQGLVEFVMVAPLLLLLILGLVEFARGWNIRHVITDAAREGARNLAIANSAVTPDSVRSVVDGALRAAGLNVANATVTIACEPTACPTGNGVQGERARVSIAYPYQLVMIRRLLGWAVGPATLNIRTSFVMRNE